MRFHATADNVIIKVKKKVQSPDELLIETDKDKEEILQGEIVAVGHSCNDILNNLKKPGAVACAYKSRVASLPWATDEEDFFVVKEDNIYGILEE